MEDGPPTGRNAAGRGSALGTALAEAAYARLERGLLHVAERLSLLSLGAPRDPVDELARQVSAVLRMEELAAEAAGGGAAVRLLERFLLAQQIASPVAREVITSLAVDGLEAPVVETLAATVAELVAMVDADARDRDDVRIYLTSGWEDGDVVVAFAAHGVAHVPVPTVASMRAFRRAERLVQLLGGTLVRGVDRGMLVVGMLVPPTGAPGSMVPGA